MNNPVSHEPTKAAEQAVNDATVLLAVVQSRADAIAKSVGPLAARGACLLAAELAKGDACPELRAAVKAAEQAAANAITPPLGTTNPTRGSGEAWDILQTRVESLKKTEKLSEEMVAAFSVLMAEVAIGAPDHLMREKMLGIQRKAPQRPRS